MHRIPAPNPARSASRGFSLPEIALSLAVLSIAFVSLFALLPFGLSSFRASIDTSNETWIMQSLNSMVQTTEWEKLYGPTSTISEEIYYYDEEGRLTDTKTNESADPAVRLSRLYQAKIFTVPLFRPAETSATDAFVAQESPTDAKAVAIRVLVVMTNISNVKASAAFAGLETAQQVENLAPDSGVTVRAFVATEMNAVL